MITRQAKLNIVYQKAYSEGLRAKVNCYGANDVQEGVAIMHKRTLMFLSQVTLQTQHVSSIR